MSQVKINSITAGELMKRRGMISSSGTSSSSKSWTTNRVRDDVYYRLLDKTECEWTMRQREWLFGPMDIPSPKRIILTGTHGTGKTTMFNYLTHELRKVEYLKRGLTYRFREEPIREIQRHGFPINQKADDTSQLSMAAYHMQSLNYPCLVSDRCIVDLYVYARFINENGGPVTDKVVKFLEQFVYHFAAYFNGLVFLFNAEVDAPIADDGLRDQDFFFRNGINSMMFTIWQELGKVTHNRSVRVTYMPDRFADRVKVIKQAINEDYETWV